ncbi:MAG: hypothetical protein WC119_00375 [Synergistaceae bacterium]
MRVDYEIVYLKEGKLLFKQFSYEMDETNIPFNSHLPDDAYEFYKRLHDANVPVIVLIGELERGSGLIRYSGADPVSDLTTEGNKEGEND